ncbi:hypothetical protein PCASD_13881 [Puccinia coronata f. sp. avenae]|uniref:Integrase catalytic domain-containing protein n=1 Tax=Puccinia coronata f. sp. avenae TaxID=200324 RepID=A0A2N5U838_9BASI|nr:hypothetical protein PCASD_13881 [Puccinia coronata f. sp. avenae]
MSVQRSPPTKVPPPHSGAKPAPKKPNQKQPEIIEEDEGYSTETQGPSSNFPRRHPPPPSTASNPFATSGIQTPYEYASDPRNRNSIVKEGTLRFGTDEDRLKADGSNFRAWFREICEFALMSLDDADFYLKDRRNDTRDPIARTVLLSSLNRSIRSPYYDLHTSFEIMRDLKQRYVVFSRAGQLNLWEDFLNIKCDESTAAAEVSASFRNKLIDLSEAGLSFTEDNIMGLVLQNCVKRGTPLRQEFDRRIDQELTGRRKRVLEFSELVDLLTDCQEKIKADTSSKSRIPHPSAFMSEAPAGPQRSASIESSPDNIYVMASRPSRPPGRPPAIYQGCFRCGSSNHMIAQCTAPQTVPPTSNLVGNNQYTHQFPPSQNHFRSPPVYHPPGYQAHYPVLTPPVSNHSFTPARNFVARHINQPSLSNGGRPADYYRPSYGNRSQGNTTGPRPSAREADAMDYQPSYPPIDHIDSAEVAVASSSTDHHTDVLFDTGATHHVTGDRSALTDLILLHNPIPLRVATNGSSCLITAQGTLTFHGPDSTLIRLKGVLYCDKVSHTLISPVALRLAGFSFSYDPSTDTFLIFHEGRLWTTSILDIKSRKWFLPRPLSPSLNPRHSFVQTPSTSSMLHTVPDARVYSAKPAPDTIDEEPFKVVVPAASTVPYVREHLTKDEKLLLQVHRRFGHVGLRVIRRMIAKNTALGLPDSLPPGDIVCSSCMISKSVNKNTLSSDQRTFNAMDAWNVDLIGPFETAAFGGGLYVLTMRDIGSGYAEVKILQKKDEALALLIDTITRMETYTKKKLKILRSDNGGEFNSKALASYLSSKGIIAERSIAYHHYQNGCIERYNRTLQDMGRTLLVDSSLPKPYWGFAFVWACYTLNRIPNTASGECTPYEKMFGLAPNLDRFRPFGAQAYVHVPAEKRKKLDDRAHLGYVVYYLPNSKGWGFWVPDIDDFVESAVATFPDFSSLVLPPGTFSFAEICNLQLGNFKDEHTVHLQDSLVEAAMEAVPDVAESRVPATFRQAQKSERSKDWMTAVQEELANLNRLQVWDVRPVPAGTRVLKAKWVFAVKTDSVGVPTRYKARYVAKGFDQIKGMQFDATFAPTASFVSMRVILSVAALNRWPVHTFNFVAAYLNSPIEEEVWVAPPEGLHVQPGDGCLLRKALYGTKQAGRCWWQHLSGTLGQLGYSASQYDNSIYILNGNQANTTIWIHVDDGIVTGSSVEVLKNLKAALARTIEINILREHWDGVSHAATPLPASALPVSGQDGDGVEARKYLSIVGSLSYVSSGTRPDITFAVNFLARFSKNPTIDHWKALNHLLNYVAATQDACLDLSPSHQVPRLSCFTDANWGGEFSRSTYGTMVFLHGCPISWTSKRLATVAASTAHAEYMALGHGTRHVLWIQKLLEDITNSHSTAHMYCDNQAAVKICSNDASNKRTRHTDRDFYITNQALFRGQITLHWIPSKLQYADLLTKNLTPTLHRFQSAVALGGVSARGGVLWPERPTESHATYPTTPTVTNDMTNDRQDGP